MDPEQSEGPRAGLPQPGMLAMLREAFYIGTIGYGGPTTLDYLQQIFVSKRGWFTDAEFLDAVGWAQLLPGSTGASAMSYLGYRRFGHAGAVAFPAVFLAPSVTAMLVLSWAYFSYGQLSFVQPLFVGLGALVVALLLNATYSLGRAVCRGGSARIVRGLAIAAVTFIGLLVFSMNVLLLIAIAGLLGFASARFDRAITTAEAIEEAPQSPDPMTKRGAGQLPAVLVAGLVVVLLLAPASRELFVAFFQVGLLAFGGGFASVALLQHVAVDQTQWLTFTEFRDGIALGQITPGPVLITATFAGYRVGGLVGSLAATVGIFLPPVVLTMLLADLHGKVKRLPWVQAVLSGLQCGFIGLVAAITVRFGLSSLGTWQTWTIFLLGAVYLRFSQRSPLWAIVGAVGFSLLFIGH